MTSPNRPAGEQRGREYACNMSTDFQLLTDQRVIRVQFENPRSCVEPGHYSDCYTDADSATAKNATNIIVSVAQYKTGLLFMESSVIMSIS